MHLGRWTNSTQVAFRASVAAGLSVGIANLLHLEHPLYALIAAVIVTDLSSAQTRRLALRRLVATLVGGVSGATLGLLLPPNPWTIALGIFTTMLVCELAALQDAVRVAGYTCGIVILSHTNAPWSYAFYRLTETVLGIVVAWAISFVPLLLARQPDR